MPTQQSPRKKAQETVDIVLMASGFSRRFGNENKLTKPFCGIPLAQRALTLAAGISGINKIYFVYADDDVGLLANDTKITNLVKIKNYHPQNGGGESARLGAKASSADYYIFLPCDMPFMDSATINKVKSAKQPGKIVCPVYGETPGNPVLFSSVFHQQLLALKPGQPARNIMQQNPASIVKVTLESETPLQDIDTADDFVKLENEYILTHPCTASNTTQEDI